MYNRHFVFVLAFVVSLMTSATALPLSGRYVTGIVKKVDLQTRQALVLPLKTAEPLGFTWNSRTVFAANKQTADAGIVKRGAKVRVIYHRPFFGPPYVSKVALLAGLAPVPSIDINPQFSDRITKSKQTAHK